MGAVYRAYQHSMDREVALKVMRRDLASVPDAVKRFFREAKAASRLHNPHAITVFDFGQTDDELLFIVMEMLYGQSLADVVGKTKRPMNPDRAANIIRQVLVALADAHAIGVLHRDLKPDNIFLLEGEATKDFVKVLDFGIAKMLGSEGTSLTGTGLLGTPTYMSPEQARGEELDTRSDLYAVGVILFELLAGKPPFQEKTPVALLVKKANEGAPSIFHVNPNVRIPEGLVRLVAQLLASEPGDRPSDAKEVMSLLVEAMESSTEPGVPMPTVAVHRGTSEIVPLSAGDEEGREKEQTAESLDAGDSSEPIPQDRRGVPWKGIGLALLCVPAGVLGFLYFQGGALESPGPEPVQPPGLRDAMTTTDEGTLVTGLQIRAELDAHIVPDADGSRAVVDAGATTEDTLELPGTAVVEPKKDQQPDKKVKKRRPSKRKPSTGKKMSDKDRNVLKILRRDRESGTPYEKKRTGSGKTDKDRKILELLKRDK